MGDIGLFFCANLKEGFMMKKKPSILLTLLVLFSIILPNSVMVEALVSEDLLGYKILAESVKPDELVTVKDFDVYDGDTADFILERDEEPSIKARFLLIDAPEMNQNVPYKVEARDRVIELFEQANLIQIEYEGAKKDKYGRDLVHIWVDGILLQEILVTEGLAVARYIHGYLPNSKYAETIYFSQEYAQRNALNVWKDGDTDYLSKAEFAPRPDPVPVAEVPASEVVEEAAQQPAQNVYYKNCTAVRAAGAAPIYPEDPGWDPKFDRDNDGIGCE